MKTFRPSQRLTIYKLEKDRPEDELAKYSIVDWGPIAYIKVEDGPVGDAVISMIVEKLGAEIR